MFRQSSKSEATSNTEDRRPIAPPALDADPLGQGNNVLLQGIDQLSPPRTWRSMIWSTWDNPPEEARFLTKLDLTLISASALGVMIRYLDQVNITNAFNSGMKEDLKWYGDELNYANALWSAAYVFGQFPSNLLLTRVPSVPYYIAFIEFVWMAFTFATAAATTTTQLYVIQFFCLSARTPPLGTAPSGQSTPRPGTFHFARTPPPECPDPPAWTPPGTPAPGS